MRLALTVAAGLTLILIGLGASAAPPPSADAGGELAARWCAGCHVVAPSGAGVDNAPRFQDIAKDRAPAEIRTILSGPHAKPMKGFKLKRHEVEDVAAYIESLENRH
jgi:mono/diheme cytochrome c family protein